MPKGYGFPVASKTLYRSDQDRAFKLHRQRVQSMRAGLDNSPPRQYPHLILRLKQTQTEEEYLAQVDHENKLLLQKMMKIMQKPRGGMDNWNDYQAKSLNQPYKTRRDKMIEQENLAIARRLEAVKPIYSIDKWEDDHKRHQYYLELWAESTKDYTPRGSKRVKDGSSKGDDQYEDDFESDDEEDRKDKDKDERLPEIKQEKDKGSKRSKSESSVQKLPKIHGKKHDPKLYMYWGKYFNADPEDNEDGKTGQAAADAKQLFRVAKALAPPTDIVIRTLIRRTPKQRQMIKKKFNELYDLDLVSELKNGLGKEWHLLIVALLPDSQDGDDGEKKDDDEGDKSGDGPEDALHAALEKGDIPAAVRIICGKNRKQLTDLKEAYKKEYATSLEADIETKSKDPERLFLLTLLKDRKDEGKKDGVQQEATDIFEQGDGRWSSPNGEFIKLLETRSNGHMRAVLKKYEQVSDGTTALQAIEKECSKSYAEAVAAFLNSKGGGKGKGQDGGEGGSSSEGTEYATLMYKNMNPENATFVNLLVERAEVDMPTIRKAYKKKYKTELHEDLEERSRHPTVRCLVELILKTPPSQAKGKDQGKQGGQRKGHIKQHDQQHGQKNKGHDKKQDGGQGHGQGQGQGQNSDSPFGQTSKRGMADARENKKDDSKQQKKKKEDSKADEDAEKLHKAMDGLGTDEDVILDIIIKKSNAQRQALKKKYKEKYKNELVDDLKSELSGDFEEVILGLLMPPVDYDAYCLNKAVKGLGTNEAVLIGILCTANPKELASVKEKYKKAYGEDLDAAVKGDTSGGFADLLLALLQGQRDQGTAVNEKEAKEDAKNLFKDKKTKLDMKSETFINLMTKKNKEQVKATFAEYKKLSGMTMEQAIKEASSGDEEDGYVGLLSALDDPVTFYADSLQKAFKGLGTNDDQLIRIIVSRSEVDLPAIKAKFQERHGRSLRAAIEDETSGDYKKALIKIVDKKKSSEKKEDVEKEEPDTNGSPTDNTGNVAHSQDRPTDIGARSTNKRQGDNPETSDNSGHPDNSPDTKTNTSKKAGNNKTDSKSSRQQQQNPDPSKQGRGTNHGTKSEQNTNGSDKGPANSKQGTGNNKASVGKEQKSEAMKGKESKATKSTKDKKPAAKGSRKKEEDKKTKESPKGSDNTDQKEDKTSDPAEDAEKLHEAMKGFGTDEKTIIEVVTASDSSHRQQIRQAYTEKYGEDLMAELDSELSGDFRNMLLDLMRLPWERELQALISSVKGAGTDESLLVHVLLTHGALSTAELSQKFKDAQKEDLVAVVESETSGNLRRLLRTLLKLKLNKQKPDKRSADDVAKQLHSGGKPLLQTKPADAIDMVTSFSADKMAELTSCYQQISGHTLEEDIKKHLSGDAEMALLAFVSHSSNPEMYEDDMLHRSLEGETTFRIFSLIVCNKEGDLQKLEERYEAKTGTTLKTAVEKELKGDVRTLVLEMLARATREQ